MKSIVFSLLVIIGLLVTLQGIALGSSMTMFLGLLTILLPIYALFLSDDPSAYITKKFVCDLSKKGDKFKSHVIIYEFTRQNWVEKLKRREKKINYNLEISDGQRTRKLANREPLERIIEICEKFGSPMPTRDQLECYFGVKPHKTINAIS